MKVDATNVLSRGMTWLRLLCDKAARPHVVLFFWLRMFPSKKGCQWAGFEQKRSHKDDLGCHALKCNQKYLFLSQAQENLRILVNSLPSVFIPVVIAFGRISIFKSVHLKSWIEHPSFVGFL